MTQKVRTLSYFRLNTFPNHYVLVIRYGNAAAGGSITIDVFPLICACLATIVLKCGKSNPL
ncbi:MAG TPA: hypothetical protein VKR53_14265, partial [Puia sp.]|nr:hypothetical protein [Puia sp.]